MHIDLTEHRPPQVERREAPVQRLLASWSLGGKDEALLSSYKSALPKVDSQIPSETSRPRVNQLQADLRFVVRGFHAVGLCIA